MSVPFALSLVPGFELLLFLLPIWIVCALAALGLGILGLRNARIPGGRGRDYAWVGVVLGGLTFLLVLAFLAFGFTIQI